MGYARDARADHPSASDVRRLTRVAELRVHTGCVNRLAWRQDGRLLASVSDDCRLVVTAVDGAAHTTRQRAALESGHRANVFGVAFMPHSDVVVTGAMDAQVRAHTLGDGGREGRGPAARAAASSPGRAPCSRT